MPGLAVNKGYAVTLSVHIAKEYYHGIHLKSTLGGFVTFARAQSSLHESKERSGPVKVKTVEYYWQITYLHERG